MGAFTVIWSIDVDADSPKQAAQAAQEAQTRPDTTATIFLVQDEAGTETTIDLSLP